MMITLIPTAQAMPEIPDVEVNQQVRLKLPRAKNPDKVLKLRKYSIPLILASAAAGGFLVYQQNAKRTPYAPSHLPFAMNQTPPRPLSITLVQLEVKNNRTSDDSITIREYEDKDVDIDEALKQAGKNFSQSIQSIYTSSVMNNFTTAADNLDKALATSLRSLPTATDKAIMARIDFHRNLTDIARKQIHTFDQKWFDSVKFLCDTYEKSLSTQVLKLVQALQSEAPLATIQTVETDLTSPIDKATIGNLFRYFVSLVSPEPIYGQHWHRTLHEQCKEIGTYPVYKEMVNGRFYMIWQGNNAATHAEAMAKRAKNLFNKNVQNQQCYARFLDTLTQQIQQTYPLIYLS